VALAGNGLEVVFSIFSMDSRLDDPEPETECLAMARAPYSRQGILIEKFGAIAMVLPRLLGILREKSRGN